MQLGIRIPSQAVRTELCKMGFDATSSLVGNDHMNNILLMEICT